MKDFFLQSFEKILNQYLQLDPESKKRLERLNGKIITLELIGLALTMQMKILQGKILLQEAVQEADVSIKGLPLFLVHTSLSKTNRKKFFAEEVKIEGDLELGQQIIDLFDELEIDWEEHLSKFVGDIAAHQIGNVARQLKSFSKKTREVLCQNVNEYVHEEIDLFPSQEALQDFFHDIDAARMDADRLELRLRMLLNK